MRQILALNSGNLMTPWIRWTYFKDSTKKASTLFLNKVHCIIATKMPTHFGHISTTLFLIATLLFPVFLFFGKGKCFLLFFLRDSWCSQTDQLTPPSPYRNSPFLPYTRYIFSRRRGTLPPPSGYGCAGGVEGLGWEWLINSGRISALPHVFLLLWHACT